MSQVEAAIASLVIVLWIAVLMAVSYRAGKESKACCFRHGRDAPMVPSPKLPGMHLKPVNTGNGGEVIFRSRALD